MSLPKMTTPVNNISLLDDLPNAVGGLSAAELKARFDKAGGDIQTFLNETLIPAIEQMGVDEGAARDAAIQAAIDALELDTTVENLQKAIVAAESRSKEYADTKDAANLAAAKQYADDKAAAARSAAERTAATDATSKANAALLSAKNYANQQNAVTLLNARVYTDEKIPTKLPNPRKLKFTGAATGEYDGSEEKTINIPTGGGDVPAVLGNLAAQIGDAAAGTIPVYAGDEAWDIAKLITEFNENTPLSGYIPDTAWVAAYMAAQKALLKLLPDSAAADAGKLLQVGADGNAAWGDKLPTALKNPKALTFTGAATGTYDGSEDLTVNIPAGGSSSSGGALKAMSAVGGYIGIPAAELPENGVVWMCFGSGDSTELYTGTVTIQDAGIAVNDMLVITNGTVNPLNQVSWVSDGLAVYGLSTSDYRGVYQVVGAGGGSGSESWTLVAETTTTENVNLLRVTFDACSAVAIEFYWGGVENDLGNIGIFPNAEGTPYIGEKRLAAANVTSSATKKCGVLCAQIDCRVGSHWYATSWQKDRGDGSFGAIDASKYNNLDIGVNGSAQYSLINNYYMNPRNDTPASGVRSITAYGAGMAIGTTLKVWGIKK